MTRAGLLNILERKWGLHTNVILRTQWEGQRAAVSSIECEKNRPLHHIKIHISQGRIPDSQRWSVTYRDWPIPRLRAGPVTLASWLYGTSQCPWAHSNNPEWPEWAQTGQTNTAPGRFGSQKWRRQKEALGTVNRKDDLPFQLQLIWILVHGFVIHCSLKRKQYSS